METIKNILLNESKLILHVESQNTNYFEYISTLFILFYDYSIELTIIKKAKILVAALLRKDKELSTFLLSNEKYDLPVILKCCEILDSSRLLKQLNLKTDKFKNKKNISKHKSIISNLKKLNEEISMSLTKSIIKFIKENWIKKITKEKLETMTLIYPTYYWKRIINLLHVKPTDFQLEWFSSYIFENNFPTTCLLHVCKTLNKKNIAQLVYKHHLSYEYLRINFKDLLTNHIKNIIFDYTPLNNIIRHWDDFCTPDNISKIEKRLSSDEILDMPYGELMKRLQLLNDNIENKGIVECLLKITENKLSKYNCFIEGPVVVFGDASGSMEIAIKTSSIITSILCKICNAKMHLFRGKDEPIENPPRTVIDVINMSNTFFAHGSTAPAASLYNYLLNKEIVKTFIIVTDEEENSNFKGEYTSSTEGLFADIFKQYYEEVYPAKLVFVSFIKNNQDGQMVNSLKKMMPDVFCQKTSSLKEMKQSETLLGFQRNPSAFGTPGIEKNIIQFILNRKKPDLRKLDLLLDTLSLETNMYDIKCNKIKKELEKISDKELIFNQENITNLFKNFELNEEDVFYNLTINI